MIRITNTPYDEQKSLVDGTEIIPIPCGHCIDCRLSKSREWAARCMFELKTSSENCFFITLTYDDEHLPINEYWNDIEEDHKFLLREDEFDNPWLQIIHDAQVDELHEILDQDKLPHVHPIKYEDVQGFLKRLRSHFDLMEKKEKEKYGKNAYFPPHSCRYFGCAEYGPKNLRPHYHLIMFDVPLTDLKVKKVDPKTGFIYYVSKTIADKWNNGFHIITQVQYDCCAYVAGYVLKKQYGKNADIYEQLHIPPERSFMSRRPGIGKAFYDMNKEKIYENDSLIIAKGEKHFYARPPKYYDSLFDLEDHEKMESIKEKRLSDINLSLNQKKELNSLSYRDNLESEERAQIARTKILKERSNINESFNC